ncbi:helix-turn-helix domain-containing protein [Changpingibacter yushuensis]|uniref:helix-turn-helix domain-containing protein n=1 Tax=Changpingibacter yushuensis TaxID=2758440 RepID=UPI001CB7276C|nr:helix-turn-helix transcriptional regulator [Changpingibacter yushuensis]
MSKQVDTQQFGDVPAMTEQERMSYAGKLRGARVEARLTQAEVAEQAGIALNTYAAMENGSRVPQAEKLWAAMLILGLRPRNEDPEWLQEWWAILRPLILRLPRDRRGVVMGQIVSILGAAVAGEERASALHPVEDLSDRPAIFDPEELGLAAHTDTRDEDTDF